jgi:F-type H+-transporting ATPase subunit delta
VDSDDGEADGRDGGRVDENLGRVRASVRTTVALTDEERRILSRKIGQVRRSQEVVLEEIVDPTMLGGLIVESGGVVLEGQLERMRHRLASG